MTDQYEYEDQKPGRISASEVMHNLAFACILLNIVFSPWFFGSWEMWWFWPMAALIFAGCFFSGLGVLLSNVFNTNPDQWQSLRDHFSASGGVVAVFLSYLPFLLYALLRRQFDSGEGLPIVAMEAERSLLLFITPTAICLVMFLSFTRRKLRLLISAFLANAILIAIYATVNQFFHNGDYVLWVLSEWDYGGRAKAVFFCPNHLSAYLNLAICLCTALLCAPRTPLRARIAAAVMTVVLFIPDFLTLSRGGLASLALGLLIGISTLAMRGYSLRAKIIAPAVIILAVVASVTIIVKTDNPLMARVKSHGLYNIAVKNYGTPEFTDKVIDGFWYSFDRGMYIQSALRAWKSNPVWGIGPGQHPNRWQEFNPTDPGVRPVDGDPATMKRPRYVNNQQHLYEVHSDWTQLLEEYGVVGLALFLVGISTVVVVLFNAQTRANRGENAHNLERSLPLAAQLACLVMAIHSLGDFSFQMPSITWTFAALVFAAILSVVETGKA